MTHAAGMWIIAKPRGGEQEGHGRLNSRIGANILFVSPTHCFPDAAAHGACRGGRQAAAAVAAAAEDVQEREESRSMPAQRLFLPLFAAAAITLSGCAVQPQNIALDPPLQVAQSQAGQGKVVQLAVRDARPRKTLGMVGDLEGKYAPVSIDNDFSSTVYQRISAALQRQGFKVQPTPSNDDRRLDVEVREVEYQSLKEGLTYKTEGKAAIAAIARSGDSRYERIYRAGETRTSPTVPSAEQNTKAVNNVVAMTLEDMLNDDKMTAVLVR
jgi:uncharacterized lipoprotein